MNIVSFNVNGLRSILNKDLMDFINNDKSDIYCFQETKMQIDDSIYNVFKDYPFIYFNNAIKKGYSGTLIISKLKPLNDGTVEVYTQSTCNGVWFGLCNGNIIYVMKNVNNKWQVKDIYAISN